MEEYPVSFQDYTVFHFDEPFEQTEIQSQSAPSKEVGKSRTHCRTGGICP